MYLPTKYTSLTVGDTDYTKQKKISPTKRAMSMMSEIKHSAQLTFEKMLQRLCRIL